MGKVFFIEICELCKNKGGFIGKVYERYEFLAILKHFHIVLLSITFVLGNLCPPVVIIELFNSLFYTWRGVIYIFEYDAKHEIRTYNSCTVYTINRYISPFHLNKHGIKKD